MNPLKYLKARWLSHRANQAKAAALATTAHNSITTDDFDASLANPTAFYIRAYQDFHRVIPEELREHRRFFQQERRGFGEDAFHSMWWHLVRRFRPANFLEIGVYRGQTISLVSLIARLEGIDCRVQGISPFSSAGDSVSNYAGGLDYLKDTLANFRHFGLPEPALLTAYSTDEDAVDLIRSQTWDCIYIDGNHDYEIVKRDWEVCSAAVSAGGIIVLDDSGLSTSYQPPRFATGGHPGPSQLASELTDDSFTEILQVGHNRVFHKAGR